MLKNTLYKCLSSRVLQYCISASATQIIICTFLSCHIPGACLCNYVEEKQNKTFVINNTTQKLLRTVTFVIALKLEKIACAVELSRCLYCEKPADAFRMPLCVSQSQRYLFRLGELFFFF